LWQTLKVEESRKFSDGTVAALLELKFKSPLTGLDTKVTWDSSDNCTQEMSYAHGANKLTFTNAAWYVCDSRLIAH
jgi:hypothetical protein